jgi:hypothetical protein
MELEKGSDFLAESQPLKAQIKGVFALRGHYPNRKIT